MINSTSPGRPARDAGEARRANFEALLEALAVKDRTNIERHMASCDEQGAPERADLWKRLIYTLHQLASHALQTTGQRAIRFYVADGNYRMQAFALEDPRDHTLMIYTTDVLQRALDTGVLSEAVAEDGDARLYAIDGEPTAHLKIEQLTQSASDGPDYYRHMVGWNRKAMRITLPVSAGPATVRAAEELCALAAISPKNKPPL